MGDDIRPVGSVSPRDPVSDRRDGDRRQSDRRASTSRDLVPVQAADPADPESHEAARPAPTPPPDANPSAFAAQIIGQGGHKRGIKGGPPVLDSARSTYLGSEYSGVSDRRPKPGGLKDTDI